MSGPALKHLALPKTQLTVSQLCLGTNQFGTALNADQAAEILAAFTAAGGNFIDTAHSYGDWVPSAPRAASEHVLGQWLQDRQRADFVLATKGCEFDYRAGDYALRVTPELLEQDLLGSLEALQTDYIDLYWLHRDNPAVPVATMIDALIDHQCAGRIRYFGCSNWSAERIEEAQRYAAGLGHSGFSACQPMWGLAEPDRQAMQTYAPGGYYEDGYRALHEAGLSMIPYSGQSRGFFSKVVARGADALSPDVAALYYHERNLRKVPVIESLAERHGASINDIVLAYLTSQPHTTVPIIGCSYPAQLEESIRACALHLDADELAQLAQA